MLSQVQLEIKELEISITLEEFSISTEGRFIIKFKSNDTEVDTKLMHWAIDQYTKGVFESAKVISIKGFKEFMGVIVNMENRETTIAEMKQKDELDDIIKIDKGE